MKGYHVYGNFYKRKHFIGGLLTVLKAYFIIFITGSKTADRYGVGEVAESFILSHKQREKEGWGERKKRVRGTDRERERKGRGG